MTDWGELTRNRLDFAGPKIEYIWHLQLYCTVQQEFMEVVTRI